MRKENYDDQDLDRGCADEDERRALGGACGRACAAGAVPAATGNLLRSHGERGPAPNRRRGVRDPARAAGQRRGGRAPGVSPRGTSAVPEGVVSLERGDLMVTKHDVQLTELTDALRLSLTAESHRSDEVSDDAFIAAHDYLQENVVRVESDTEINLLTLKMKDGRLVELVLAGDIDRPAINERIA